MTKGLTPPSVSGELSSLKKRVSDLERRLDDLTKHKYLGIPFSLGGPIYISESPPWSSPVKLRISSMVVILGSAGTTTTTVELKVNDATVITVSLGAEEIFKRVTLSKPLAPDVDFVKVAVTAAGETAKNLDVIIRFP